MVKKQIGKLETSKSKYKKIIEEIRFIYPGVFNEFESWTPLKLILLNYVFDMCSIIINKQSFFKKMYYVDLFAGSGLNRLSETSDFLIGSPLITALTHGDKYDKMFFCENDEKLFSALEARINSLKKDNLVCVYGDSNNNLDGIMKTINEEKYAYSFFFIDPFAMEFPWSSMKKVLGVRSDVVFTLMTSQIIRSIDLANKFNDAATVNKLNAFFGDDSWRKVKSPEDINALYQNNIKKERKGAITKSIKVRSAGGFFYDVIFITTETKGGSPWIKVLDGAKKEIETHTDKAVDLAMDIIKNRQQTLS